MTRENFDFVENTEEFLSNGAVGCFVHPEPAQSLAEWVYARGLPLKEVRGPDIFGKMCPEDVPIRVFWGRRRDTRNIKKTMK